MDFEQTGFLPMGAPTSQMSSKLMVQALNMKRVAAKSKFDMAIKAEELSIKHGSSPRS